VSDLSNTYGQLGTYLSRPGALIPGSNKGVIYSGTSGAVLTIGGGTGSVTITEIVANVTEAAPNITVSCGYTSTDGGPSAAVRVQIQRSDGQPTPTGAQFFYDSGWQGNDTPSGGTVSFSINAVDEGIPTDTGSGSSDTTLHLVAIMLVSEQDPPASLTAVATATSAAFDIQWGVSTLTWNPAPPSLVGTATVTADWAFSSTRGFLEGYWEVTLSTPEATHALYDSGLQSAPPATTSYPVPFALVDGTAYLLTVAASNSNGVPAPPLTAYFSAAQSSSGAPLTGGPLSRFLAMLAFQLDVSRSLIEQLRYVNDPMRCPGNLLPALAQQLGVSYEAEMGMEQTRKLLATVVHQYKTKGTYPGMEGISSAVTGWGATASSGPNMMLGLSHYLSWPALSGLSSGALTGTASAPTPPSGYTGTGFPTTWPFTTSVPLPASASWATTAAVTMGITTVFGNVISAVDASFEGSLGSWSAAYLSATLTLSSAYALDGSNSGLAQFLTGNAQRIYESNTGNTVVGSGSYVVMAAWRAVATARDMMVELETFDSSGTSLGFAFQGATVTDNDTGWTYSIGVGTVPSTAVTARIQAGVANNDANGQLPAPGAPTVTVEGTAGTTTHAYTVTASNAYGSTPASPATTTAVSNATLSSTDYNLIGLTAVPLPAGSSGNLIYDSNLTNAIATLGPTWTVSGVSIGTANGDLNVLNAGTDSAQWVYYGTGTQTPNCFWYSVLLSVTPGVEYMFSVQVDAAALTDNTGVYSALVTPGGSYLGTMVVTPGAAGLMQTAVTIPAGCTEVRVVINNNGTTTAGETISWSQIQLTETSAVQPYAPGPLPTYGILRDNAQIGTTTALAFEDTGQAAGSAAPTVNTTGESHAIDCAGVFPADTLGYQLEVLSDSPTVYYPLTDSPGSTTAYNAVGSGAGTVNGGVTFGQPGVVASDPSQTAALFDGSTGCITCPASLLTGTGPMTVECWLDYQGGATAGYPRLVTTDDAETKQNGFALYYNGPNQNIGFYLGNGTVGTSGAEVDVSGVLASGWHHAAATFDGTDVRLYVDGVLVGGPVAFAGTVSYGASDLQIGTGGPDFFKGVIGHVAVFPTALSPARIAAHYNAALNTTGKIVQKWTDTSEEDFVPSVASSLQNSTVQSWGIPLPASEFPSVSVGVYVWASGIAEAPEFTINTTFWDSEGSVISTAVSAEQTVALNAWAHLTDLNIPVPSGAVWCSFEASPVYEVILEATDGLVVFAAPQLEGAALDVYTSPRETQIYLSADRINLVANPSFENGDTTGWSAGTNCGIAVTTSSAYAGTQSLEVTATAAGAMSITTDTMPLNNLLLYTASVYLQAVATAQDVTLTLVAETPSSDGTSQSFVSLVTPEIVGQWERASVSVPYNLPLDSDITRGYLEIQWANAAAGEVHLVDAALLEPSAALQSYFDGDTNSGLPSASNYLWTTSTSKTGPSYYYSNYVNKLARLESVITGVTNDSSLAHQYPLTVTGFLPVGTTFQLLSGAQVPAS